jgi:hypothetical protein
MRYSAPTSLVSRLLGGLTIVACLFAATPKALAQG